MENFGRGMYAGILGLCLAYAVYSRYDQEENGQEGEKGARYSPYMTAYLLPVFLGGVLVLVLFSGGTAQAVCSALNMCFSIFWQIGLYYGVLLIAMPVLRRGISARTCAALWLVPNYLYITRQTYMQPAAPKLVITVPGNWAERLVFLWLAGVFAVLLWKTGEHLLFRRQILKDAVPVTDPMVLDVWAQTLREARMEKTPAKLVISDHTATPLSIGLFSRWVRVVLPRRSYSREELELILRHEIVHLGRQDAWSKYFMVFCTAMCWFNPLMWLAMKRSADDLELSCDETVLMGESHQRRREYAALLLETAGDERGFTTCLSATARAMRYRLRCAAQPVKRRSGALLMGAVFFLLCMTSGYTTAVYGGRSLAEVVTWTEDLSACALEDFISQDMKPYTVEDEGELMEYLAGVPLYELVGSYSFSDSTREEFCHLMTPEGLKILVLYDEAVKIVPLHETYRNSKVYYTGTGLDWSYLDTLITQA